MYPRPFDDTRATLPISLVGLSVVGFDAPGHVVTYASVPPPPSPITGRGNGDGVVGWRAEVAVVGAVGVTVEMVELRRCIPFPPPDGGGGGRSGWWWWR